MIIPIDMNLTTLLDAPNYPRKIGFSRCYASSNKQPYGRARKGGFGL